MFPKPSSYPIHESFIGIDDHTYTRGITELYLPHGYGDLKCEVDLLEIEAKNIREASLKLGFTIKGDQKTIENLYSGEEWKYKATKDFLKYFDIGDAPKNLAPVFCLMLNKTLRVDGAKLWIDSRASDVLFDQAIDLTMLPNSFPPLVEPIPEDEFYRYYEKKTTAFYASLQLNKRYVLEIELETDLSLEFAPLFPFGEVGFKNAKVSCMSAGDINLDAKCGIVNPIQSKSFPQWLQKRFDRKLGVMEMPQMLPAFPYRGTFPVFEFDDLADLIGPTEPEKIILELEHLNDYKLGQYQSLRFMFMHLIPHGKDFEVIIRRRKSDIPVRIYNQLHDLPNYHDILVDYDVLNMTKERQNLQFETELLGFTEKQIERKTVLGMDNGNEKPARIRVSHCPRLKRGIINSITSNETATLSCKVVNLSTGNPIFEHTYEINVLPKDQMIWEVKDEKSSYVYNLRDFICAWIQPVDNEGLLDKVRTDSIKYHPDEAFGHRTRSLKDIEAHAKAVYECLKNDYKLKYLSQPFNSKGIDTTQRVVLPQAVIKNRAGNCIDLTVLFASILEGVGIHSLIFIMPGHAFIGWGNPSKTAEMIFLETTMINTATFEEAKAKAEKTFKHNFLFVGSDDPLPTFMTGFSKGCYIIDVESVRRKGLVAEK